jgi:DNA-binding transcriptional LysR family regulator
MDSVICGPMKNLSGLLAFVEAADGGSFVEAGRKLGVSSSAIGKAVARLESELGVRLLHRSTRRISLTQEGAVFHARCRQLLEELRDAQSALSHAAREPAGRLRVSLPTAGYHFFTPHLPEFVDRFPNIVLDLNFTDHVVDVIAGGFDAVIRSVRPADSQLVARHLGAFSFRVCAARSYLAGRGTPRSPADLAGHRCLALRFETTGKLQPWVFRRATLEDVAPALICNNLEALLAAVTRGVGLAYVPDFIARDAVASGILEYVLEDHMGPNGAFWLLWPSGAHVPSKLRAFIDFFGPRLFAKAPRGSGALAGKRR